MLVLQQESSKCWDVPRPRSDSSFSSTRSYLIVWHSISSTKAIGITFHNKGHAYRYGWSIRSFNSNSLFVGDGTVAEQEIGPCSGCICVSIRGMLVLQQESSKCWDVPRPWSDSSFSSTSSYLIVWHSISSTKAIETLTDVCKMPNTKLACQRSQSISTCR
jgi:hypothetical protein